jgi:tetratricopeptide (TPR) repeat protein
MRAYDLYIRGLHHYHQLDRRGIEIARNMYTSAIIHDPAYALAYCGLADCYSMIVSFYDRDPTHAENALTASEKALSLDPGLAEAHASHGLALSLDGRFEEAYREFGEAVALSPKLFEAYYFHARAARQEGNLALAAELFEKASEMRPEDYQSPILAGDTYRGLDRHGEVEKWFRRGLAAAEKHLELHPGEARAWYLGAHAQFEMGDVERAREWNEKAMALGPRDSATLYNAACLFALMGEIDRCFDCFQRAVEHGFSNRRWLERDPDLASIRGDARYPVLLAQLSPERP